MDREFEAELAALRERLLRMAGRVERMIGDSVRALEERDSALAERTVLADNQVNQDELDIDAACLHILARRQPMASDLRFITLVLKMVPDLERIGDLAVNVAERALDLNARAALPGPFVTIPRMAEKARVMVAEAIEALLERDANRARRVIAADDEVDDAYKEIFQEVLERMRADASILHRSIHVQSVAKYLERIGDHATNLAEQVIFFVDGDDVRHEGKLPDAH